MLVPNDGSKSINLDVPAMSLDTLDDLLNDLNAIAHELGTDQPTQRDELPEDTSPSHRPESPPAENGFSAHNSSGYDFPTIKKAPPPPPTNPPNLDAEFDSIMNQLNTLDGRLEGSDPPPPGAPAQAPPPPTQKKPVIQPAKRVSFKLPVTKKKNVFVTLYHNRINHIS